MTAKRKIYIAAMRALMYLSAALTAGLVLFMIIYVMAKGIPNITWELLSSEPSHGQKDSALFRNNPPYFL